MRPPIGAGPADGTRVRQGCHRGLCLIGDHQTFSTIEKLYDEIAPRYGDRNSGFTRIVKLGPRPGDNAPMVQLELV